MQPSSSARSNKKLVFRTSSPAAWLWSRKQVERARRRRTSCIFSRWVKFPRQAAPGWPRQVSVHSRPSENVRSSMSVSRTYISAELTRPRPRDPHVVSTICTPGIERTSSSTVRMVASIARRLVPSGA